MYQVGGNQGNTYSGQEGRGKAFILPEDDDAMLAFQNLLKGVEGQKAAEAKGKLDAAKQAQATKEKLKQEIPEWWLRYDAEMQSKADSLMKLGADLMAAGVPDPLQGNDAGSNLFKKELERLKSLGNLSMQYKSLYEKDREVILNDKDGKYSNTSKDDWMNFWPEKSLEERLANGDLPPRLMVNEPEFELMKHYQDMAKALANKNPNPEDKDFEEQIGISLTDPSTRGFNDAIYSQIEQLKKDPNLYTTLINEAKANAPGTPPEVYLATKQLKSFFGDQTFDMDAILKEYQPATKENRGKFESPEGVTSWNYETYLPDENLTTAAKAALEMNPALLKHLMKTVGVKDKQEAIDYMKELWKARIETKKETGTSREGEGYMGTGRGEKEVLSDRDLWYQAVSGGLGDTPEERYRNQKKAQAYIVGTKDSFGRTVVSGRTPSNVTPSLLGMNIGSEGDYNPNMLVFEFTTPKDIEYENEDGQKVKETAYTSKEIPFQLTDKGQKNYFSKDMGHNYFIQGLKNKRTLFKDMLNEEGDDWEEVREADKNAQTGMKSNAKQKREEQQKGTESEDGGILNIKKE